MDLKTAERIESLQQTHFPPNNSTRLEGDEGTPIPPHLSNDVIVEESIGPPEEVNAPTNETLSSSSGSEYSIPSPWNFKSTKKTAAMHYLLQSNYDPEARGVSGFCATAIQDNSDIDDVDEAAAWRIDSGAIFQQLKVPFFIISFIHSYSLPSLSLFYELLPIT
jgi:hypothetical protein